MTKALIQIRLDELGLTLPVGVTAAAQYVPGVLHGDTLYLSGQIPRVGSDVVALGKVGDTVSLEQARAAAEICALRLMSVAQEMLGSLDRVTRVVEVCVFVNSAVDFVEHSAVADAASQLLLRVFGEKGRHARTAVGVAQLPKGACVEISAVLSVDTEIVGFVVGTPSS